MFKVSFGSDNIVHVKSNVIGIRDKYGWWYKGKRFVSQAEIIKYIREMEEKKK